VVELQEGVHVEGGDLRQMLHRYANKSRPGQTLFGKCPQRKTQPPRLELPAPDQVGLTHPGPPTPMNTKRPGQSPVADADPRLDVATASSHQRGGLASGDQEVLPCSIPNSDEHALLADCTHRATLAPLAMFIK
jgi:hypothetical protein